MSENVVKSLNWWPTPIVLIEQQDAQAMNEGLARIIREQEAAILAKGKPMRVAGVDEGLTAHWMNYNVLNWDFPETRELRRMVLRGFAQFVRDIGREGDPGMKIRGISCWANRLHPGQHLEVHHHDPAFASAHYTVSTGLENGTQMSAASSGETVYYRPGFMDRSHGGRQNGSVSPWDDDWQLRRAPRPGNMIFFPSYVRHEVRPNFGHSERISIAMDIFVHRQELLMHFSGPRWYVPKEGDAAPEVRQGTEALAR